MVLNSRLLSRKCCQLRDGLLVLSNSTLKMMRRQLKSEGSFDIICIKFQSSVQTHSKDIK